MHVAYGCAVKTGVFSFSFIIFNFQEAGFLAIANFVMDSSTPPNNWTASAETSYRGISNYLSNEMGITFSAMNELGEARTLR